MPALTLKMILAAAALATVSACGNVTPEQQAEANIQTMSMQRQLDPAQNF